MINPADGEDNFSVKSHKVMFIFAAFYILNIKKCIFDPRNIFKWNNGNVSLMADMLAADTWAKTVGNNCIKLCLEIHKDAKPLPILLNKGITLQGCKYRMCRGKLYPLTEFNWEHLAWIINVRSQWIYRLLLSFWFIWGLLIEHDRGMEGDFNPCCKQSIYLVLLFFWHLYKCLIFVYVNDFVVTL